MGVLLLLVILILPMVSACLPLRWAWLGLAGCGMAGGLIWLDAHVVPFGDDGDRFGLGALIFGGWLMIVALALVTIILRAALGSRGPAADRPALWPGPIGILLGVFFMHWLSNRLAGTTPAGDLHVATGAVGAAAGWLAWKFRPWGWRSPPRDVAHVAIAGCLTVSAWAIVSAMDADRTAALARETADGAPYCVLTFAGREHPRPARNVLELSRLVSRSGGRSFIDDAHWLIIDEPDGMVAKRLRSSLFGPTEFDDHAIEGQAPPCTPRIGGNLDTGRKRSPHPPLTVERG